MGIIEYLRENVSKFIRKLIQILQPRPIVFSNPNRISFVRPHNQVIHAVERSIRRGLHENSEQFNTQIYLDSFKLFLNS